MKYECYRCGWTICIKTKMTSHLERKYTCKNTYNDIILDGCKEYILSGKSYEEYLNNVKTHKTTTKNHISPQKNIILECKYCEKTYSRIDSLHRHNKNCKEKKKEEEVKDSMDKLVKLLNDQLDKRDKELKEKDNQLKKELDKRDKQIKNKINK